MRKGLGFGLAVLSLVALPAMASAATLTGTIGFSGSVIYDGIGAPGSGEAIIDFAPTGGGSGTAITVFSQSGDLANIDGATLADIYDLTNVFGATPAYCPLGPCDVPNFIRNFTDPDAGALHFDLTEIIDQSATPACTDTTTSGTCSIGPFVLTETASGLRIDFDVLGNFVRGTDSGLFSGSFSTTFGGMDFETALPIIESGSGNLTCTNTNTGQPVPCSFDANFHSVSNEVPEPASMLLLGSGLVGLAAARRRAKKQ